MCNLTETARNLVKKTVEEAFLPDKRPFTGYEVYRYIKDDQGTAFSSFSLAHNFSATDVSAYVRELFNSGEMPGWASTQVIPKEGPVLYFWVSDWSLAGKAKKEILQAMKKK